MKLFYQKAILYVLIISSNSTILGDPNSLTQLLKPKLINSPYTDLSLLCAVVVQRLEKSNVEIEIVLFLEFVLFNALMTV